MGRTNQGFCDTNSVCLPTCICRQVSLPSVASFFSQSNLQPQAPPAIHPSPPSFLPPQHFLCQNSGPSGAWLSKDRGKLPFVILPSIFSRHVEGRGTTRLWIAGRPVTAVRQAGSKVLLLIFEVCTDGHNDIVGIECNAP